MIHLISYDLNDHATSKNYKDVEDVIAREAIEYVRVLDSGWMVYTNKPPVYWYEALLKVMDEKDRLIVNQLHTTDMAYLSEDTSQVVAWTRGKL